MTHATGSTAAVLLLALLLRPISAQRSECTPLSDNGCCGPACQQGTCETLYMLGSSMGAADWHNRTGWATVLGLTGGPGAACAAYMESNMLPAPALPPYCSWYGITCNTTVYSSTCSTAASGTTAYGVSRIEITNNNPVGFVNDTSFMAPLKQLHDCYGLAQFILGGGSFRVEGTLPAALGELDRLEVLALFASNISGTLPASLGRMRALQELDLSANYITGTIPPELGNLQNLQTLNLGYNGFSDVGRELLGTVPASFTKLSNLTMLMLEHNALTGTLPALCSSLPRLEAISLRNNDFHGPAVQFGACYLSALDLSVGSAVPSLAVALNASKGFTMEQSTAMLDNNFSGPLPVPTHNSNTWNKLQMLRLNNNRFVGPLPKFAYGEAPVLSAVVLSQNSLTGTIPLSWTLLPWLTIVDLAFNQLSGTLPWQLAFQSKLSILNLNDNKDLSGTISPFWRFTVGLSVLNLGNTNISGALPGISRSQMNSGLVPLDKVCSSNASGLGRLPSLDAASIAGTMMSAACLVAGTSYNNHRACFTMQDALPWYLTTDNSSWQIPPPEPDFADNANMACPSIVQDMYCERNSLPLNFSFDQRPRWSVSPSYYHYIGCECEAGYVAIHDVALHGDVELPRLRCVRGLTIAEVAGISVVASIVGLALISYCVYVSWSGRWGLPKLRRAYVDIQKRLHGAPTSGKVSLVVTDIESYSALMVAMPLVMAKALSQHNNAVRKAAWMHFGNTVCQEGDSYTIAFKEAIDAVAFCLQVQQALQKIDWPEELLSYMQQQAALQAAGAAPATADTENANGPSNASDHQQQASALALEVLLENGNNCAVDCADIEMTSGVYADGSASVPFAGAAAADGSRGAQSCSSPPVFSPVDEHWFSSSGTSSAVGSALWLFRTAGRSDSGQPREGLQARRRSAADDQPDAAAAGSGSSQHVLLQQQPQMATVDVMVPGLRVRMGVASGVLDDKEDCMSSKVLQVARVVSDAGSGGQVLIDSNTFSQIKDRLEELGQVGSSGYSSQSRVVGWGTPRGWLAKLLARNNLSLSAEALVLDMGLYSIPGFNLSTVADAAGLLPDLPCSTAPSAAADGASPVSAIAHVASDEAAAVATHCKLLGPRSSFPPHVRQQGGPPPSACTTAVPAVGFPVDATAGAAMMSSRTGCLRLYQVLAPKLVERAHLYGNNLSLKDGSVCYDLPYFCAPAAATRPTLDPLRQQLAAKHAGAEAPRARHSSSRSYSALGRIRSMQQRKLLPPALCTADGDSSQVMMQDTAAGPGVSSVFRSAITDRHTRILGSYWWRRRQDSTGCGDLQLQGTAIAAGSVDEPSVQECMEHSALQVQAPSGLAALAPLGLGLGTGLFDGDASVTFVFCSVVNPRAKLTMDPSAKLCAQVASIVSKVLKQCLLALAQPSEAGCSSSGSSAQLKSAGYLCREMKGDMKYIMVFGNPRSALEWCLLVQEVMLWQDWPAALFDLQAPQPSQRRNPMARISTVGAALHGTAVTDMPMVHAPVRTGPLFRGPRIKMGVAAGAPQCVGVDHMGRADYHGNAINMAARYEMVCAQGGQVVCEAALAAAVVAEWRSMAVAAATRQQQLQQHTVHDSNWNQLLQNSSVACPADSTPLSSAVDAAAAGPPAGKFSSASRLRYTSVSSSAAAPVFQEDSFSIGQASNIQEAPAAAAAARLPGRAGIAGVASAGSAAMLQTQPLPIPLARKRAVSEQQLPPNHFGSLPNGSAAAATGSIPCPAPLASSAPIATGESAPAGGTSSSTFTKASAQATPSSGGLASWLASGSKASFGQFARVQAGRKMTGGKGLRLAQRQQHRAAGLVMAPAATELPCALCVPQLPAESFGVDVHQLGKFMVKGHTGPVEVVELSLSHLSARRRLLADVPPKSQKGRCIQPLSGHIASVQGMQLPGLAQLYKQLHEQRKAAAAGAALPVTASGSLTQRQGSITQLVARASSMLGSLSAASSRALSWERVGGAHGVSPGSPRGTRGAAVQPSLSQPQCMNSTWQGDSRRQPGVSQIATQQQQQKP